ncbi:MAG: hypothetical protein K6E96_01220, partial [Bacteroidales bacterium]|nr:hypothetical protein [Bacteroidales bacterium]
GFEPWDQQAGQRFSRPPRSTTPAPLHVFQCFRVISWLSPSLFRFAKIRLFFEWAIFFFIAGQVFRFLPSRGADGTRSAGRQQQSDSTQKKHS